MHGRQTGAGIHRRHRKQVAVDRCDGGAVGGDAEGGQVDIDQGGLGVAGQCECLDGFDLGISLGLQGQADGGIDGGLFVTQRGIGGGVNDAAGG